MDAAPLEVRVYDEDDLEASVYCSALERRLGKSGELVLDYGSVALDVRFVKADFGMHDFAVRANDQSSRNVFAGEE